MKPGMLCENKKPTSYWFREQREGHQQICRAGICQTRDGLAESWMHGLLVLVVLQAGTLTSGAITGDKTDKICKGLP